MFEDPEANLGGVVEEGDFARGLVGAGRHGGGVASGGFVGLECASNL
jgi:hypothetical protein